MADDKLIRDVIELLLTMDRKLQRIEAKLDDLLILGEDQS